MSTQKPDPISDLSKQRDTLRRDTTIDDDHLLETDADSNERSLTMRVRAVAETAGALSDVYRAEELKRLRDDWPA